MWLHHHVEHKDSSLFLHGKTTCYLKAASRQWNSTPDWGRESFEKRNANQVLESSQVWITEFLERGRDGVKKNMIMHFCPLTCCEGGWTTEKQSELPPGPQLLHLHKPCLTPAGTSRGGLGAIPRTVANMCFVHASLLQTPYLVVGRLNVFLTSGSYTTKVVYLIF